MKVNDCSTIRVLIVDDQRLLRQCFKEALQADPSIEVVATAADGSEAVLATEAHTPDVVLMDLAMPRLDGTSAASILLERAPDIKILMLSLHDSPEKVERAMKAGVAGFVSKDVDLDELIRIIKAVNADEEIHSPFLANQRNSADRDLSKLGLSEREIQVLKLLVHGYNNSEIAEKIFVSEQTVKKEFVHIFEKLDVKNRTQAAVRGVHLGLLDEGGRGR